MPIISTEAIDIIEMQVGLSDETVNTAEIRGKADAGSGSPLRGVSVCLVDCADNPSLCERWPSCISRDIWEEASKNMQLTLEDKMLAAMVERQKEKINCETGRYYTGN